MTNLIPVMRWFDPKTGTIIETTAAPIQSNAQAPLHFANGGTEVESATYTQYGYSDNFTGKVLNNTSISIDVEPLHEDSQLPTRGHHTDAGLDLYSYIDVTIPPFGTRDKNSVTHKEYDAYRVKVPTGVAMRVPHGFGLFLWDRSGMSAKYGQHRVAGVVDSSYTGEVIVALVNLSQDPFEIKKGDRIAQGIISPILLPSIRVVDKLQETLRGSGGFGSTGA